ncbi:NadS family protein [Escherichia coli]
MSFFDELKTSLEEAVEIKQGLKEPGKNKMSFFDELKTSLEEAVEIKQGLKEPARMTRYEIADAKAVVDRKRCSRRIRHSVLNA